MWERWASICNVIPNCSHLQGAEGVRSDLTEGFRMINGYYDVTLDLFFTSDNAGKRGHSKKLFKRRSILDIRKHAFSNRIVDKCNALPGSCMQCTGVNKMRKCGMHVIGRRR